MSEKRVECVAGPYFSPCPRHLPRPRPRLRGGDMDSDRATSAAAAVPADPIGREPHRTLAGLIAVLDRADGVQAGQRPRPRHPAASRSAHRPGSGRTVPLRSVQPAPMARRLPGSTAVVTLSVPPLRKESPGGPVGLLRRIALWGAGPRGEYLAWPGVFPRPAGGPARAAAHAPGRFSALIRRAALWGAGPRGEYLAWSSGAGRPAPSTLRAERDSPVLPRELPTTPTVQRAAPSPAAALVPAGPASSPTPRLTRGAPTVAGCSPPGPSSPAPSGWSPAPTGWPQPREWRPSRQGETHSTPPSPPASHSRSSSLTSTAEVVRSPSSSPAAGTVRTRGDPPPPPLPGGRSAPGEPRRSVRSGARPRRSDDRGRRRGRRRAPSGASAP